MPDPVVLTTRTCSVDLTLDLSAPRTSRKLVTLLLEQWGIDDREVLDGATIVVSELVTNALVHGDDGGPITLGMDLHDQQVILWVTDRATAVPAQRAAAPADENGRGLSIVSQLAIRWGVEPTPTGKRVYAELPLPATWCA